MGTDTQKETDVDTHGSDIGSGFTTDPEDTQVLLRVKFNQFALVNGSNSKFSLDSSNSIRKRGG